ncbi:MAG: HipA N-terminal domain-containing protein, partial [Polyangiaceae bacterium]|nr:HipA N-terminal domain-containing protein [Polyangiaceae bacterium]
MVLEDQFRVWLHDCPIGRIHRRADYTRFVFDPAYRSDPLRAVLGLCFEDNMLALHTANMRLPSWFSNLLPEGRLRELIGRARGVCVEREMELLAEVGHDLPGAVRVLPEDAPVAVDLTESDTGHVHQPVHSREGAGLVTNSTTCYKAPQAGTRRS